MSVAVTVTQRVLVEAVIRVAKDVMDAELERVLVQRELQRLMHEQDVEDSSFRLLVALARQEIVAAELSATEAEQYLETRRAALSLQDHVADRADDAWDHQQVSALAQHHLDTVRAWVAGLKH